VFLSFCILFCRFYWIFPRFFPLFTFARVFLSFACLLRFAYLFRFYKWPLPLSTQLKDPNWTDWRYSAYAAEAVTWNVAVNICNCSGINVRAHQIAAAAAVPAARADVYRSCACRELVVVLENLKPLSRVELEHAVTLLNDCDRVFLRCRLCFCVVLIKHNTQYSQNWFQFCFFVLSPNFLAKSFGSEYIKIILTYFNYYSHRHHHLSPVRH
jgi:hypothetical protein